MAMPATPASASLTACLPIVARSRSSLSLKKATVGTYTPGCSGLVMCISSSEEATVLFKDSLDWENGELAVTICGDGWYDDMGERPW